MGSDPFVIEETATDRGLMWQAVVRDSYGRMADATRLTSTPSQAVRDGLALIRGTYWCSDARAPYTTAA